MIMRKVGSTIFIVGKFTVKTACAITRFLMRILFYLLKTIVVDGMMSEAWRKRFLKMETDFKLWLEEATEPEWHCENCGLDQPGGTFWCLTEGCGAPGPSVNQGSIGTDEEDAEKPDPIGPADATEEDFEDMPPLEEVDTEEVVRRMTNTSWEVLSETGEPSPSQSRTRYVRTGPMEVEEAVLKAVGPAMKQKLKRMEGLPLSHLDVVCKRRGLPLTGSAQMKRLFLAACDNRRETFPDDSVDAAVDGRPLPRLRAIDDHDARYCRFEHRRYVQTGQVEAERQVINTFPLRLRTALKIMKDYVDRDHLDRIVRGRGLPVSGTKLMKCIHVLACSNRREEYPCGQIDTISEIPNETTEDEQATETASTLMRVTRHRMNERNPSLQALRQGVLNIRRGGPSRPQTEGEDGAQGLDDTAPSFPSPFAHGHALAAGSAVCIVVCFLLQMLRAWTDAAGAGGVFVINSTTVTVGEVIRRLGSLAQTAIATLENIVEGIGVTWDWCMERVTGFGDLVFFASAVWIKALIAIIAISVIFYMIEVIAEDPEILHLGDGLRFAYNLMRRMWSFLLG